MSETRAGKGDVDGITLSLDTRRVRECPPRTLTSWMDLIAAQRCRLRTPAAPRPAFAPGVACSHRAARRRWHPRIHGHGRSAAWRTIHLDTVVRHLCHGRGSRPCRLPITFARSRRGRASASSIACASNRRRPTRSTRAGGRTWVIPPTSNPQPRGPGHIVGLTWDSAIRKFGIDRGAGVWSDEGNPDKVRFWFAFGELGKGVGTTWKSQRLTEGLPVMTTGSRRPGVRYEVEQFAYPLHGPPAERRGDMPMVLLQRPDGHSSSTGTPRSLPIAMTHRRQLPPYVDRRSSPSVEGDAILFRERGRRGVLLAVQGGWRPAHGAVRPIISHSRTKPAETD